jgi:hypothetical protein
MNFEALIRNWHNKTIVPEDYFSNFVFEYLAFIAYLKKIRHFEGSDRDTIQDLKMDRSIENEYKDAIESNPALSQTLHNLIDELREKPIRNVSSPEQLRRHWTGPSPGVINSIHDWTNIVEFWYTVRNNLFHGLKDPENERDMQMAKYAYKTLSPLVGIFVSQISGRQ